MLTIKDSVELTDKEYLRIERETISLGNAANSFLKSELGEYLISRANQKINESLVQLKNIDPFNGKEIIKCQNEIKSVTMLFEWLAEAIMEKNEIYAKHQGEDETV
jgi:hypothetical protein